MDDLEQVLRQLLEGNRSEAIPELCDFSLLEQNEVLISKGIAPSAPSEFIPQIRHSVSYIVAAVIINEKGEVLMIQEAKESCAGQWYLPAGRMEPGEDIEEAVKREVLEETGFDFEPTTLLVVEEAGALWVRFVFAGYIIGGKLKTPANADCHSLQAKWVSNLQELTLRAKDIVDLIERGRLCKAAVESSSERISSDWHPPLLPCKVPQKKILMRLVICCRKKANNCLHVLVCEKTCVHLPTCEINPTRNSHATLKKYMMEIFGADLPAHRPHGILCLEHCGKPTCENDGFCLNVLVSIREPLESIVIIDKYSWREVSVQLANSLLSRMGKNMTVPLNVIR